MSEQLGGAGEAFQSGAMVLCAWSDCGGGSTEPLTLRSDCATGGGGGRYGGMLPEPAQLEWVPPGVTPDLVRNMPFELVLPLDSSQLLPFCHVLIICIALEHPSTDTVTEELWVVA